MHSPELVGPPCRILRLAKDPAVRAALRVGIAYAILSAAWILLSDQALALLIENPARLTELQSLKGTVFVSVTAVLLFFMVRRDLQKFRATASTSEAHIRAQRDSLEAINAVASAVHHARDHGELARAAVATLQKYAQAPAASFFLVTPDGQSLVLEAASGLSSKLEAAANRLPIAGSLCGVALERREVVNTLDAGANALVHPEVLGLVAGDGLQGAVAVPLIFQDAILGSVSVYFEQERALSPLERQTFTAIGRTIGVALANTLHIERLEASLAEQRRTAEALRSAEERLRVLLDTVPTRLFWKDHESRYLGCNTQFALDAGVASPADILGLTDYDLPSRRMAPAIQESDRAVMASGKPQLNLEMVVERIGGGLRSVSVNNTPLRDADGTIIGVLGCYEDITARKQVETELKHSQKMQAMGELTGGVAHDFKNVLSVIITNAELLAQSLPTDAVEGRATLTDILAAATGAAGMVRKLLGLGRRAELDLVPVDLRQVISGLAPMLSRLLPSSIQIGLDLDQGAAPVLADQDAVEQMVLNLVTNARDAMPKGGRATIQVRGGVLRAPPTGEEVPTTGRRIRGSGPLRLPGQYVVVSVIDTGAGMSAETLARVFEPFFTTKPPGVGTGLGMPMVYGLMKQHDGFMEIESSPGVGTTVTLCFPVAVAPLSSPRPRQVAVGTLIGGTETVLFVDDQPEVRRTGARGLRRYGYTVLEAANGLEALDRLQEHRADIRLIVSDLTMPEMDGLQLLREIRRMGSSVPFLITTGMAELEASEAGASGPEFPVLAKPWTLDQMLTGVRRTIDGLPLAP